MSHQTNELGKDVVICDSCDEEITGHDLYHVHWAHEKNCPRRTRGNGFEEPCDCDLVYHEKCCPTCNAAQKAFRALPH